MVPVTISGSILPSRLLPGRRPIVASLVSMLKIVASVHSGTSLSGLTAYSASAQLPITSMLATGLRKPRVWS
ncbi:hypothetical protein D3C72_2570430 [compost metagenome]